MKLSDPKTYRLLFALGLVLSGVGIIFEELIIMTAALIMLILSKYGMRKEHKEKKERGEIK
jgi:hypothetical protein